MTSIDPMSTGTVPATDPGTAAPHVSVRLFAGAAAEYGADATTVQAETVQEAVNALLVGASAEAARVIERSSFLINAIACTDRDQALADGDRMDVLPPFAGG